MNVIVANKNKDLFSNLDVDVIRSEYGEFTVEELIQMFSNFFFNRMFLDITAIEGYENLGNIQKLSMNMDMSKVIFYLDDFESTNNPNYISNLISMGIYNFTRNLEGLMYLYNHPNSYKDVAHLHILGGSMNLSNNNNNNNRVNTNKSMDNIMRGGAKIIGFKNLTLHAGATSLVYMIKKYLSTYKNVVAIEVDKKDFTYFRDRELVSISDSDVSNVIDKYRNVDVILIDLNNSRNTHLCDDVIYLVEPSTIRLNRLMLINKNVFNDLRNHKIVLNKSLLDSNDISDFEREAGIKLFANIPPINDKGDDFSALSMMLNKLEID